MGVGGREVAEMKLICRGFLQFSARTDARVDEERNGSVGYSFMGYMECTK